MSTPNYPLALALSAAGWSNGEAARRINAHAELRGHRGIAIDAARVGRWIRNGEKPRPPVPAIISELLIQEVGELLTAQDLRLTKSTAIRVTIEEPEYATLLIRAEASNLTPDAYVRNLVLADIATHKNALESGCPPASPAEKTGGHAVRHGREPALAQAQSGADAE